MSFPTHLKYSKEHEWIQVLEDNTALIGITAFAAGELGDIVYVDVPTVGDTLATNDVFGSVEAVKTVSDLFLPVAGKVLEVNEALTDAPELINTDAYDKGWIIKIEVTNPADLEALMDAEAYAQLVG